jgi:predicted RNA-binding Zn ribbon-like protein
MADTTTRPNWDFDAGLLPLDFANTAEWHASPDPIEKLTSYDDLVGWSQQAGLLAGDDADALIGLAGEKPTEAAAVLQEALALREAIYAIFSAVAAGGAPPGGAMDPFNAALAGVFGRARIEPSGAGFAWSWPGSSDALDGMLGPILLATAELLTSDDLKRVGECADDHGCGYLFYDTSRNHSRRWCSMESCGNRAKARRHYGRSKARS